MTINQLKYVLALYKYKNFTTAAEKSLVSQPSLSMQVQKLEKKLNTKIFDRSKKPIETTEIGEKLIKQFQIIISESLKVKDLANKALLSDEVGTEASIISKVKSTRMLVHSFQLNFAYNPPKNYKGSCLDGRDITYNIIPDAEFKFFITANVKTRALRRYKELKKLKKKISYEEVLKSIKKRDKSDYNRKISPLKKTKDSVLINTTNLSKRACFLKIKKIIDGKINI